MRLKSALLAACAAGALALTGVGVASAATPAHAPVVAPTQAPGPDQPEPGDIADAPGAADKAEPGDTPDAPGQAEPAGEQPDGADGPGGHADPAGAVDHQGGPQEQ